MSDMAGKSATLVVIIRIVGSLQEAPSPPTYPSSNPPSSSSSSASERPRPSVWRSRRRSRREPIRWSS